MTSDLVGWDEKSVVRRCGTIEYSELEIAAIRRKTNMQKFIKGIQGRIQEFVQGGGLNFLSFQRGISTRWGLKNPLKSIDFTGPGGA